MLYKLSTVNVSTKMGYLEWTTMQMTIEHSRVDTGKHFHSWFMPLSPILTDRELDCLKLLSSVLLLLAILLTNTTSEFLRPSSHKLVLSYFSALHLYFQSFLKLHRYISTYLGY